MLRTSAPRVLAAVGLAAALAAPAGAATIRIDFTGFSFGYERVEGGGAVVRSLDHDVDYSTGSRLESVDFFVDGNLVGQLAADLGDVAYAHMSLVVNEEIPNAPSFIDLATNVPGLSNFQIGFDADPGNDPGDLLKLDVLEATGVYLPFPGTFQISSGNTRITGLADGDALLLPFGVTLTSNDDLQLNILGTVSNVVTTDGGTIISSFDAEGTGQILGVPEPASLVLAAAGCVVLLRRRR